MKQYYLGVDVGNTKTHAMLADQTGAVRGLGHSGDGNPESVGYTGLQQVLQESSSAALAMAGVTVEQVKGAGFGIAGYDWPSQRLPTLQSIAALGLDCPVEAVNDVDVGLIAGASQGWGLVVDAGTGNNVRGRTPDGRTAGITGCGWSFGEFGGAGDLVWFARWAISHEWTGRGAKTRLTPVFMQHVGASDIVDFLEGLHLERYTLEADLAPLVFQTAEAGDAVAQEVIRQNSRELGYSALGIIRQLAFQDLEFEVVMIGSMFNGGPLAYEPMQEVIWSEAPQAQFTRLGCPPVAGGILLGMQTAGLDPRPLHQRVVESASAIYQSASAPATTGSSPL